MPATTTLLPSRPTGLTHLGFMSRSRDQWSVQAEQPGSPGGYQERLGVWGEESDTVHLPPDPPGTHRLQLDVLLMQVGHDVCVWCVRVHLCEGTWCDEVMVEWCESGA